MKRLVMAGALAFATALTMGQAVTQSMAADLPQLAPMPARAPAAYVPMVAPVYNWGGIYWGINGGYGFGSTDVSVPGLGFSTGNFNTSGYVVGGTFGANYQFDAFVVGIEGDLDATGINGTNTSTCVATIGTSCETKNTWLGTVRGRAGYAADRVLFYGTAGAAFGNIESGPSGGTFASVSKTGWTAGAGVEAAFADNWTARVEYLFVDLGTASFTGANVKFDANLVRVGLDYKFR